MYVEIIQDTCKAMLAMYPESDISDCQLIPCENKPRIDKNYFEFDIPPFVGEVLSYYTNGTDSNFFVNGEMIDSHKQFDVLINKHLDSINTIDS